MCNIIVPCGERNHGFPLDHKNLRVGDRLGGECVLRAGLYTEDVARQIEGSDLAATVVHSFEGAHRSADHFAEITRCAVPECRGISHADATFREALWDRFFTAAPRPRTPSELLYSDRRLRSKSSPAATILIRKR